MYIEMKVLNFTRMLTEIHTLTVECAKGQRLGVDPCESKYHVTAGSHK